MAGVDAFIAVLLERLERDWAEDFLRHAELSEEAFEVLGFGEAVLEAAGEQALAGAGRAEEERVLAGERGEEEHARLLFAGD